MTTSLGQALAAGSAAWRQANRVSAGLAGAVARRAALARQPRPQGIDRPKLRYLLGELAVLVPRGGARAAWPAALDPQPVLILPGFGAHPYRMRKLEHALAAAGHHPYQWGLGFNLGPTPESFAFLMRRVAALYRRHGQKVAIVGWSLGGIYGREIARRMPDQVSKVITLGSPFSGDRRANNAWRAYELITGHGVDEPPVPCEFAVKPPVPTIALWSPRDGVVHARAACGWPGERDRAVSLRCTHLGFASAPEVIAEVLSQLDIED